MGNPYFMFKQFTVWQQHCAMKVTTDGAVFGAVLAAQPVVQAARALLDVGTGTGLLALMVAQQNPNGTIDAVEIEAAAAQQAADNFTASPWANRLRVMAGDVMDLPLEKQYDVVISNPPFFEDSLRGPQAARNAALHNSRFSLGWFSGILERTLLPEGHFYVLLPAATESAFVAAMQAAGWHACFGLRLCQTERHPPFRSILGFAQGPQAPLVMQEVPIKRLDEYDAALLPLLAPYYLHL